MKTIEQLLDELIAREGGYSDNSRDAGGATMWGITEAVARANGYGGPMRELPKATAKEIYRRLYWTRPGFDLVDNSAPRIAAELFDTGVNMGPAVATTFLQRALTALNRRGLDYPDLIPDGRIGPATLAALHAYLRQRPTDGVEVLIRALDALQGERYIRLAEMRPGNEEFLYGWLASRLENAA
jgi:lysozyme family protein